MLLNGACTPKTVWLSQLLKYRTNTMLWKLKKYCLICSNKAKTKILFGWGYMPKKKKKRKKFRVGRVTPTRQLFFFWPYVKNLFFKNCGYSFFTPQGQCKFISCRHSFVMFEIWIFEHRGPFGDRGPF